MVLSVEDSGMGIDADMLPRVFEMFTQEQQALDRSQGGLGLGLAIVRSLVKLHGGTVEAASRGRGQGALFTVRLPRLAGQPSEAAPPAANVFAASSRASGRRILIVDDNQDAAEMLAEVLGAVGYETRVALDGPAALEMASAFAPHVALLDIGLPVMDGYELSRRLKEIAGLEELRLIAVTGYGQERDRRQTRGSGFDSHLVKPIDIDELTRIIDGLTAGPAEHR